MSARAGTPCRASIPLTSLEYWTARFRQAMTVPITPLGGASGESYSAAICRGAGGGLARSAASCA
jgi:hypothetical protein